MFLYRNVALMSIYIFFVFFFCVGARAEVEDGKFSAAKIPPVLNHHVTPKAVNPARQTLTGYKRKYVKVKREYIPFGSDIREIEVTRAGNPDEISECTKRAAVDGGFRPLVEHMKENAKSPVCAMNSVGCAGKIFCPFSRTHPLRRFNYLKDTLWVWDYDLAHGLLSDHAGKELVKADLFYALSVITGTQSLLSTDGGKVHTSKKSDFKGALG